MADLWDLVIQGCLETTAISPGRIPCVVWEPTSFQEGRWRCEVWGLQKGVGRLYNSSEYIKGRFKVD